MTTSSVVDSDGDGDGDGVKPHTTTTTTTNTTSTTATTTATTTRMADTSSSDVDDGTDTGLSKADNNGGPTDPIATAYASFIGNDGGDGTSPSPFPTINIAVLSSSTSSSSTTTTTTHAQNVASRLRRMGFDRFKVVVLTCATSQSSSSGGGGDDDNDGGNRPDPIHGWPPDLHVLLVCCLSQAESTAVETNDGGGNNVDVDGAYYRSFFSMLRQAKRYVDRAASASSGEEGWTKGAPAPIPVMVLTDIDLDRTAGDRAVFHDTLQAGGLGSLLPRRAVARFAECRGTVVGARGQQQQHQPLPRVVDRRDLIEIDGAVLLKPILERSIDPDDAEVRIYYPRSDGGGCKIVRYDSDGKKAVSFSTDESIRIRAVAVAAEAAAAAAAAAAKDDNDDGDAENASTVRTSGKGPKLVDGGGGGGGLGNILGFIYEEITLDKDIGGKDDVQKPMSSSSATAADDQRERRYRKRDRLRDAASLIVPSGMLSRPAVIGSAGTVHYYDDAEITWESDLSRAERKIWIVTTASLPWMTGTAVNPLLRAAHLSRGREGGNVTLVVPWLERRDDRIKLYGEQNAFANEKEQEAYIRTWMRDRGGLVEEADEETGLRFLFYPSRYHPPLGSIFAMGNICDLIPDADADVCILEEPEHLNWYRASGDSWTKKFTFVVGVVHTNYKAYASAHYTGIISAPFLSGMSTLMVRAYCHKVIKLSAVLQTFAPEKEVVSNVHGVRAEFLAEGERRAKALREKSESASSDSNSKESSNKDEKEGKACAYFIGKILWAKGLDRLLHLEEFYKECTGDYFKIDIYGDGPEVTEIRRAYHGRSGGKKRRAAAELLNRAIGGGDAAAAEGEDDKMDETDDGGGGGGGSTKKTSEAADASWSMKQAFSGANIEMPVSMYEWRMNPIPARFLGRIDHSQIPKQYKIIVNSSITEVLCTTTAEALAMGKFAIIPVHPSNTFFLRFPNCLAFNNKLEFAANLQYALTHEPEPLTDEQAYQFTWEAATERFIRASAVTVKEGRDRAKAKKSKLDERIADFHNRLGKGQKGDLIRTILGGGPVSGQTKYEADRRRRRRGRSDSMSSDSSDTFVDRSVIWGAERSKKSRAAFLALAVLVLYLLIILWRAFDSSKATKSNEL